MNRPNGLSLASALVCLASTAAVAKQIDLAPPGLAPSPIPANAVEYDLSAMRAVDAPLQLYELHHRRDPNMNRQFALPPLADHGPEWAVLGHDYLLSVRGAAPVIDRQAAVDAHLAAATHATLCEFGGDQNHELTDAGSALVVTDRLDSAALLTLGRFVLHWQARCNIGVVSSGETRANYNCETRWTLRDTYAFPASDADRLLPHAEAFEVHGEWVTQTLGQTECAARFGDEVERQLAQMAGAGVSVVDAPVVSATASETQVAVQTSNGSYLVADQGGGGALNADRGAIGPWETFALVSHADGTVSLRSGNGRYISADHGGGGGANADRFAVGAWERFTPVWHPDGAVSLRTVNGHFLVAEWGGGHEVNANRRGIGAWERFTLVPAPRVRIAFRTDEGRYVSAVNGGGSDVSTDRVELGPWEVFEIGNRNFGRSTVQASDGRYLVAEPGGRVLADRWSAGSWELFSLQSVRDGNRLIGSTFGPLTVVGDGILAMPESGESTQYFEFIQMPGLFHDWSYGIDGEVERFAPTDEVDDDEEACLAALPKGLNCGRIDIAIADGLRPTPVLPGGVYCVCIE